MTFVRLMGRHDIRHETLARSIDAVECDVKLRLLAALDTTPGDSVRRFTVA